MSQDDLNAAALAMVAEAEKEAVKASARATQWDNIPPYLRTLDQWCFYTTKKLPRSLFAAQNNWRPWHEPDDRNAARTNDRSSWCSWTALRAAPANEFLVGPGFYITAEDDVICLDLDDPARTLTKTWWWETVTPAVRAERLATAYWFMNRIYRWACAVGAWMETSMSGNGVHIFVRGRMPFPRYELAFGGSVYGARQYVALTGRKLPGSGADLPLAEAALVALLTDLDWRGVLKSVAVEEGGPSTLERTTELGRRLNLSDAEVIAILLKINKHSHRFLHGGPGRKGDWSEDYRDLLGDLDKISGDPEQVKRILFGSPCLLNAGFSERQDQDGRVTRGRDRMSARLRLFDEQLASCRTGNRSKLEERQYLRELTQELRRQNGLA